MVSWVWGGEAPAFTTCGTALYTARTQECFTVSLLAFKVNPKLL